MWVVHEIAECMIGPLYQRSLFLQWMFAKYSAFMMSHIRLYGIEVG